MFAAAFAGYAPNGRARLGGGRSLRLAGGASARGVRWLSNY